LLRQTNSATARLRQSYYIIPDAPSRPTLVLPSRTIGFAASVDELDIQLDGIYTERRFIEA